MQSIATFIHSAQFWYGLAMAGLLAFAFGADRAARKLGMTVVGTGAPGVKREFSAADLAKSALVLAPTLGLLYALQHSDFRFTLTLIACLGAYLWVNGYRSKIRVLRRAGLGPLGTVVVLATFTLAVGSFSVALAISAWRAHGAP